MAHSKQNDATINLRPAPNYNNPAFTGQLNQNMGQITIFFQHAQISKDLSPQPLKRFILPILNHSSMDSA